VFLVWNVLTSTFGGMYASLFAEVLAYKRGVAARGKDSPTIGVYKQISAASAVRRSITNDVWLMRSGSSRLCNQPGDRRCRCFRCRRCCCCWHWRWIYTTQWLKHSSVVHYVNWSRVYSRIVCNRHSVLADSERMNLIASWMTEELKMIKIRNDVSDLSVNCVPFSVHVSL